MADPLQQLLYEKYREEWGEQYARAWMESQPPFSWTDVARQRDVLALDARLDGLRAELLGELRSELGRLRGELGRLRGELGDVHGRVGDLRAELHDAMREQTTRLIAWVVPVTVAGVSLAAAVSSLR